jgi:hypothetical protein
MIYNVPLSKIKNPWGTGVFHKKISSLKEIQDSVMNSKWVKSEIEKLVKQEIEI